MSKEIKATKSAKELAEEHGIDLADVPAADGNKISAEDVKEYIARVEAAKEKTEEGDDTDETNAAPPEDPPSPPEADAEQPEAGQGGYVAVFKIKEGSKITEPGQPYEGENAEEFLKLGSIKRV